MHLRCQASAAVAAEPEQAFDGFLNLNLRSACFIEQCVDTPGDDLENTVISEATAVIRWPCRLFRKAVQQGRRERRGESYSLPYVEPLHDASTPLADVVNSLLMSKMAHAREDHRQTLFIRRLDHFPVSD
jgi:hypothetical protein